MKSNTQKASTKACENAASAGVLLIDMICVFDLTAVKGGFVPWDQTMLNDRIVFTASQSMVQ
jgi:hypothetical protein